MRYEKFEGLNVSSTFANHHYSMIYNEKPADGLYGHRRASLVKWVRVNKASEVRLILVGTWLIASADFATFTTFTRWGGAFARLVVLRNILLSQPPKILSDHLQAFI